MIPATRGFECRIDWARPGEGRSIARMIRLSLPRHLQPFTIWASLEAGHYIEALLAGAFPEQRFEHYVLRCGGRMAGLAVFRDLQGQAFLNHLYISPQWRGRSLGAWLLARAARCYLEKHRDLEGQAEVKRRPALQVALDVMSGNHPAEAWYERLGFREIGTRGWWVARNSARHALAGHRTAQVSAPACRIAAIRENENWSFHQFTCVLPAGRRYEVGSLSGPYFRLSDPQAAGDSELHQVLASLDPDRRLLLVAPGDFSGSNWMCIAVSRRLACDASSLLGRLQASGRSGSGVPKERPSDRKRPSRRGGVKRGAPFCRHVEVMPGA